MPACSASLQASATVGGHSWNVYRGSNGSNAVFSFVRTSNTGSGSVDVKVVMNWIRARGWFGDVTVGAVHRSGHVYAWQAGCRPDQVPLADPPAWLLGQLTTSDPRSLVRSRTPHRGYAAAALASEERQLLQTPVGQRNTRLNLAAFRLGRFIATEALANGDVEAVLFDVAARLGIPPHEARATIASGLRAGVARSH